MTPRILVRDAEPGSEQTLVVDHAHYLRTVLRLRAGERIEVFDGRGTRLAAHIVATDRRGVQIAIGEQLAHAPGDGLQLVLVQGIAQAERMDLVMEKACELGAMRIVPVFTTRSMVRLDATRAARRHEHWQRIVEAACMQSGRDTLPEVDPPTPLAQWLAASATRDNRRLLLSPHDGIRLRSAGLDSSRPIELLVGPEAGLDPNEEAQAQASGYEAIRLGSRILRTETAGLAALAALQALVGDF